MGLFDFVKNAGAKIFGKEEAKLDPGRGFSAHLRDNGIDPSSFRFKVSGDGQVLVSGWVPNQETREKAVLVIGNIEGISQVDDRLRVGAPPATSADAAPPPVEEAGGEVEEEELAEEAPWSSRTYTVKKGDTLSAIAKEMYGNAGKYPVIFEANKPMLKDPDRIYPGQVLRIPELPG
ncbi:LysM and BON domain-containing protein [Pseudomarimonas salicorniae]|uniref:LysM and BON domain-containing protein n=1 Tax=Pseudomarimonas salicorniae TaxID=2933270 RepID=A0ABT0GLU7_9GAMM|nr:LysM and BON domain-containing protein [Lysobacter sp. CAU 1642]MCK7595518.1 LysM and BON domain-containing protein [Lysobacter sp. CAU 1642]